MNFHSNIHEGRCNNPNWNRSCATQITKLSPDIIELKDSWFNSDLEEYPSETPTHMRRVAPENDKNMITYL